MQSPPTMTNPIPTFLHPHIYYICAPQVKAVDPNAKKTEDKPADELESYAALVRLAGY